jgi:hypothetical protein
MMQKLKDEAPVRKPLPSAEEAEEVEAQRAEDRKRSAGAAKAAWGSKFDGSQKEPEIHAEAGLRSPQVEAGDFPSLGGPVAARTPKWEKSAPKPVGRAPAAAPAAAPVAPELESASSSDDEERVPHPIHRDPLRHRDTEAARAQAAVEAMAQSQERSSRALRSAEEVETQRAEDRKRSAGAAKAAWGSKFDGGQKEPEIHAEAGLRSPQMEAGDFPSLGVLMVAKTPKWEKSAPKPVGRAPAAAPAAAPVAPELESASSSDDEERVPHPIHRDPLRHRDIEAPFTLADAQRASSASAQKRRDDVDKRAADFEEQRTKDMKKEKEAAAAKWGNREYGLVSFCARLPISTVCHKHVFSTAGFSSMLSAPSANTSNTAASKAAPSSELFPSLPKPSERPKAPAKKKPAGQGLVVKTKARQGSAKKAAKAASGSGSSAGAVIVHPHVTVHPYMTVYPYAVGRAARSADDKLRTLCEHSMECSVHAKFSADGRWYAATLDAVVGKRYLVTYPEYGESETVDPADINCDEAWLLYEYSPGFVPPQSVDDDGEEEAEDALPSNAEWRKQRRAAREALERELAGSNPASPAGAPSPGVVPALSAADEQALQDSFWREVRSPLSYSIRPLIRPYNPPYNNTTE